MCLSPLGQDLFPLRDPKVYSVLLSWVSPFQLSLLCPGKEPEAHAPGGGLPCLHPGQHLLLATVPTVLEDEQPTPAWGALDPTAAPGPMWPVHPPHHGQYPLGAARGQAGSSRVLKCPAPLRCITVDFPFVSGAPHGAVAASWQVLTLRLHLWGGALFPHISWGVLHWLLNSCASVSPLTKGKAVQSKSDGEQEGFCPLPGLAGANAGSVYSNFGVLPHAGCM